MNRCLSPRKVWLFLVSLVWVAALALTGPVADAQAQVKRVFPHKSEPAQLEFTASARQIVVNGKPESTGPGMRVYDGNNRLVFANRLQGQQFEAQLRRGPGGQVQDIWLLNAAEKTDPRRAHRPGARGQGNVSVEARHDPAHYLN